MGLIFIVEIFREWESFLNVFLTHSYILSIGYIVFSNFTIMLLIMQLDFKFLDFRTPGLCSLIPILHYFPFVILPAAE